MAKARKKETAGAASAAGPNAPVATMPGEPPASAPQAAGDTTAASSDRERVAMRAYELYLARGGADGGALDDWLAAERELALPRPDPQDE